MTKQVVSRKPVKQTIERLPAIGEVFFNQFKRVPGKIETVLDGSIKVRFKTGEPDFYRFGDIEWDTRAGWWLFKEKKQYYVWMELSPPEGGMKSGVWAKACDLAMTEETARVFEKLLRLENPELDFAVSIGKPTSYRL